MNSLTNDTYAESVKERALRELQEETFAEHVAAEKERLRVRHSLWDRIFPWIITIKRKP